MKVPIKLLYEDSKMPTKAHNADAGFDLYARDITPLGNNKVKITTGVAIDVPVGHVGLLFPRSSIYKTVFSLANSVGVLDAGYQDEISFIFDVNPSLFLQTLMVSDESELDQTKMYAYQDRIGQLIIMPIPEIEFEQVSKFEKSERGKKGWGSSGK